MYYLFLNQRPTEEMQDELVIGRTRKNFRIVNFHQAFRKHYDAATVFDCMFEKQYSSPYHRGKITVCAIDAELNTFSLLRYTESIMCLMQVEGPEFVSEQQARLIYGIQKLTSLDSFLKEEKNLKSLEDFRMELKSTVVLGSS